MSIERILSDYHSCQVSSLQLIIKGHYKLFFSLRYNTPPLIRHPMSKHGYSSVLNCRGGSNKQGVGCAEKFPSNGGVKIKWTMGVFGYFTQNGRVGNKMGGMGSIFNNAFDLFD